MKKFLPLFTLLLLLSSCEHIKKFFCGSGKEEPREISMTALCQDTNKGGLISFIYSIDPEGIDLSEIEKIEFTYIFSNDGNVDLDEEIIFNPDYGRDENITNTGGDAYTMDLILYPNSLQVQSGSSPFGVAEIMIDMPTGIEKNPLARLDLTNPLIELSPDNESLTDFINESLDSKNCCSTVTAHITNVVVTLVDGTILPISLTDCYREIEAGTCCSNSLQQ